MQCKADPTTLTPGVPMKGIALVCAVSAVLAAQGAPAQACDNDRSFNLNSASFSEPARWAARHDSRDARLAITTEDGKATLILTDKVVAAQLSDRVLHKIERKLKREQNDGEDNLLAHTIKTAVLSSVRSVLDHSAECSIRDLSNVEYRRGRLIFTTEDGDRIFENIEISDQEVEAFTRTLKPTRTVKGKTVRKTQQLLREEAREKLRHRMATKLA